MTLSVGPRGSFLLVMMLDTVSHALAISAGHYTDRKAATDQTVTPCDLLAAEAAAKALIRAMRVAKTAAGVIAGDGVDRW